MLALGVVLLAKPERCSARVDVAGPEAERALAAGAKEAFDTQSKILKLSDTVFAVGQQLLRARRDGQLNSRIAAVSTPGHTQGHFVFADLGAGLLFSGDHVLPTITPSIGFEPAYAALPLGDFLGSLAKVRAMPDLRLLPAHGAAAPSTHARVDELVAHHEVRSQPELAALLAEYGVHVTQATLSRDLLELDAVKVRAASGSLVYAVPAEGGDRRPASPGETAAGQARPVKPTPPDRTPPRAGAAMSEQQHEDPVAQSSAKLTTYVSVAAMAAQAVAQVAAARARELGELLLKEHGCLPARALCPPIRTRVSRRRVSRRLASSPRPG